MAATPDLPTASPPGSGRNPAGRGGRTGRAVAIGAAIVAAVGVLVAGVVVFQWSIDETRFDRPSVDFDALASELDDLPGVSAVTAERWVEAPLFSAPTSRLAATVESGDLAGFLAAACATDYSDPVTWAILVRTPAESSISLAADPAGAPPDGEDRCPDFGFDAAAFVAGVDRLAPGLAVQPTVWVDGGFAIVVLDEDPSGIAGLLPLVENAHALAVEAGRGPDEVVDINSSNVIVRLEPGEDAGAAALLSALVVDHGVESVWADGGGTPVDGVERVQIVAPAGDRGAIESLLRDSGLHIADLPVRFID